MDAETLLLFALAVVLVLAGIVGMVLPVLPGELLLFGGLFAAAWAEDFEHIGPGWLAVLLLMAALAWLADFAAGAIGVRLFGEGRASRRAEIGALIGGFAGLFFGASGLLPGLFLGPFAGAVIGELSAQNRRDLRQAGRAGLGAALGVALGAALSIAFAFAMIAVFLFARFAV